MHSNDIVFLCKIIVIYKVKNCPNMVLQFFEKDKVLPTKRKLRCRKVLLNSFNITGFSRFLPKVNVLLKVALLNKIPKNQL